MNNNLELRVTNTQILPIEIIGINIDNDYLELNPINFVKGFDTNQKQFQKIIKIDCLSLKCTEENLNKIEINRVFGQKKNTLIQLNFGIMILRLKILIIRKMKYL